MRLLFSVFLKFIFTLTLACGEEPPAIGARPVSLADVARLAARLKDADLGKSIAAAKELGDTRQPSASKPLINFYTDGDGERRMAAVKALGALTAWRDPKKADGFLTIALDDISFAIRRQAATELFQLEGIDAALKRFILATNDTKARSLVERNRAVHHAAAVGGIRAAQFLRESLHSTENEIAIAAAEELGEIREFTCLDALLKALTSDRDEIKLAALTALERQSGKRFRYDLVKWAEWRASLRDDHGKELVPANAVDSQTAPKSLDYARELWPVEIVICFDTTGSFLHVWPSVEHSVTAVVRELQRTESNMRIGLVRYRALDPRATLRYTLQPSPLTGDVDCIKKELTVASFGGGSGALHTALRFALNGMIWREHSRKVIVIIGDDSPVSAVEDPLAVATQLAHDAAVLDGIQVNTLYAKTTAGEENRQTYRRIAFSGVGRFYEYNKGEQHLVEMSAEKVDVKFNELPAETARKWFTPRDK